MSHTTCRICVRLLVAACLGGFTCTLQAHSLDRGSVAPSVVEGSEESGAKTSELLFKAINTALLVVALGVLLRKPLGEFFAQRSAAIRKSLNEGRLALEASQSQLRAIEEKIGRLEADIGALRSSAIEEMTAERERLRQATAEEMEKILAGARAQFETATRMARLDLKVYAAQQALELAEEMIRKRLDEPTRRQLVAQFIAGIG